MPLGPAQLPQEGPRIGKQANVEELPEHKRAEIGDFEAAMHAKDPAPPPVEPPPLDPDETQRIEQGIETLEALKSVMSREDMVMGEPQENPTDPIEELAQPTDEEKQEFVRCVLGNRSYKKKYELFGGASSIEFSDMSPAVEEGIYRALAKAEIPQGDDWAVILDRMRLVACTVDTTFSDLTQSDPVIAVDAVNEIINKLPSATHYSVLMRAQRIFRRHLEIMLERSLDSDFWRADGSNSQPEPLPEEPSTTDENPDSAGS